MPRRDAHLAGPSVAKAQGAAKEWIVDPNVTRGITN